MFHAHIWKRQYRHINVKMKTYAIRESAFQSRVAFIVPFDTLLVYFYSDWLCIIEEFESYGTLSSWYYVPLLPFFLTMLWHLIHRPKLWQTKPVEINKADSALYTWNYPRVCQLSNVKFVSSVDDVKPDTNKWWEFFEISHHFYPFCGRNGLWAP